MLNGVNGYRFPLEATGNDFARKIESCLATGELEKMSETALEIYRTKLNWRVWAKELR